MSKQELIGVCSLYCESMKIVRGEAVECLKFWSLERSVTVFCVLTSPEVSGDIFDGL